MRVLLADELFDGRHSAWDLLEVLRFAFDGRHVVLIEPDSGPHVQEWLAQRGRSEQEEVRLALSISLEAEAKRDRAVRTICVGMDPPGADSRTIRCSLSDAREALRRPLKILVENMHNDGAFVRRLLPPSWRERFKRFEDNSWAEFENGGGLGTLKITVQGLDKKRAARTVAVFDSDALSPGAPSWTSELTLAACRKHDVEGLRLQRRAAENYLPVPSLLAWSEQRPSHKRRARAFKRLSAEQRHHYAMRDGLLKDSREGLPVPKLFSELSADAIEALSRGFGDIRAAFADDSLFTEQWLEADDLHSEREKLRALIFSNL